MVGISQATGVLALRCLLLLLVSAGMAWGHQIDEISGRLEKVPDGYRLTLDLDAAYALPEFRGDLDVPAQDLAWLRAQDARGRERIAKEAEAYLRESLTFETSTGKLHPVVRIPELTVENPDFMTQGEAEEPPMISVEIDLPAETRKLIWQEPLGVVFILGDGERVIPLVSGESHPLGAETATEPKPVPDFLRWVRIGWNHILPMGVDHILFILGIFLFSARWRPLLTQSLVFTLAHSLALLFATLGWVHLPEKPVEVVIGLSIAWIAIENLRRNREVNWQRLAVIAGFGLIHGLGFARMLAGLLPPDRPDLLITGLLGFNIGVEAGQITVLACAFGLCGWWPEERFEQVRRIASITIALTGLYWGMERCF